MRILRALDALDERDRGMVAAVGNFDGVHRGHKAVVAEARRLAEGYGTGVAVLTFEPHPRTLFQPGGPAFRLTCSETRAAALATLDIDLLLELTFDSLFAQQAAETFVSDILVGAMAVRHVVIGYDFVFGHRRRGTPDLLGELGRAAGFGVTCLTAVAEEDGAVYSSTRVRQCLAEGDPAGAAELLGRPWSFAATVEAGDRRGRLLGFPTANLRLADLVQPAFGVYAVRARIEGEAGWLGGVGNFGRRPTVNDRGVLFEVHLFGLDRDIYGKRLTVQLVDFIRPEKRFDGLDALKAGIAADRDSARALLAGRHCSEG